MTAGPVSFGHIEIDSFIDALWLEEGLSKNTLAAYRQDLTLYAAWLASRNTHSLLQTTEPDFDFDFDDEETP